ncbi:MAG: hypothetical protein RMI50_04875, partial [Aquificaceae bacterium]|nr:hypothetical protein [Aquificaceae bacterium]
MKKLNLKHLLAYVVGFPIFLAVVFFLTFPKFLFLDRELSKRNLYLTAEKVEESLTEVKLTGVNLYDQKSKLARFDTLRISLSFFKVTVYGLCEGKPLKLDWSPFSISIRADGFTCLRGLEELSADLLAKEGIYGRINIKGIEVQDTKLDSLSLELKGRVFTARAKFMGAELVGDGQIVFKRRDPL